MKIAVFSTYHYDEIFLNRFNTGHTLTFFPVVLNEQTVILSKGFDAVCLFVNDNANANVIATMQANGIRLILLRCAGFNNVNINAAAAAGIPVLRVPSYSPEAVAEHAVALMLTLNRKTHKAYNRIREGNFSLEKLMGFNLHNRKVAIIGTGNIGRALCNILMGFGCNIYAYDICPDPSLAARGVTYATLSETLDNADIVSLHCPLTDATRHMINKDSLQLLKPGTMLINTSRGGLIDSTQLIDALKSGRLGSLGLDVYEQESKLFFDDHSEDVIKDDVISRLISFPNVLITSHQGFFTLEAMEQIAQTTFNNADAFVAGCPLTNMVEV